MTAPLVTRTIAGVGNVVSRSAVTWATRRAFSPTSLAARIEIRFTGLAGAKRQLARELGRVGADAVISRDPAQSA